MNWTQSDVLDGNVTPHSGRFVEFIDKDLKSYRPIVQVILIVACVLCGVMDALSLWTWNGRAFLVSGRSHATVSIYDLLYAILGAIGSSLKLANLWSMYVEYSFEAVTSTVFAGSTITTAHLVMERYFSVAQPQFALTLNKYLTKTSVTILVILIVFTIVEIVLLFFIGQNPNVLLYLRIMLVIFRLLPWLVIIFLNIMLIYVARKKSQLTQGIYMSKKARQITICVIVSTFASIVVYPFAQGWRLYNLLNTLERSTFSYDVIYLLEVINHGVNFAVYIFFVPEFSSLLIKNLRWLLCDACGRIRRGDVLRPSTVSGHRNLEPEEQRIGACSDAHILFRPSLTVRARVGPQLGSETSLFAMPLSSDIDIPDVPQYSPPPLKATD